jgi:septum formation protein
LNPPQLVLASRSPRRAELLTAAGIPFTMLAADIDETPHPGEGARDCALRLSREKAAAVEGDLVLAADTVVVLDAEIMGKPADLADAIRMLRALSGREHEVITAVCLRRGASITVEAETTRVRFAKMSEAEIVAYADSGEPMDKAGAYGIQGLASRYVERIEGSYSNVVGLPVALVYRLLHH